MTKLTSTDCFHPVTQSWFEGAFEQATKAQKLAWKPICAGQSTLLLAPTGSGKTLAAFLSAIDRLLFTKKPEHPGVRVLYISPLKALAVDVERNLRSPLVGIQALAMRQEVPHNPPVVAVRSGDTPQSERAKMARKPPDILITTPESLYLVMTSKARSMLEHVETIIIDEIHTMVSSKRGTHLMLTLERIEAMREHSLPPLQRIGLSATQRPLTEVAQFLGGYQIQGERSNPREVSIVDAGEQKKLKLSVEMPAEEMIEQNPDELDYGVSSDGVVRSSWANLTPRIVELIQANRSTIIFVNSRRSAEKLAAAINEKAGILLARAHHGSLAHNIRTESEEQLKMGHLPAIVATASLELGIDMGAVELVIQVGAFPSVSSGLQRIGRSRHHVGGIPEGVSFPKHDSDLLASAVVQKAMLTGQIEASSYPRNPLDVLAQQIAAMIAMNDWPLQDIYSVVRRCAAYRDLSQDAFEGVLDMMSGRYPADDFSDLRPTIVWDRVQDHLSAR
ncbi:MAG: DEAD/DEAH box helicase, partial [Myxococcota bacterium]|nr:DEAD/DEAH box helicase [Myxococcota bacterium]